MSSSTAMAEVCAAERLANALLAGIAKTDMEGRPLTEAQQSDLLQSALLAFDGFARELHELAKVDDMLEALTPHGEG